MNDNKQELFLQFEKQTSHRRLLNITEYLSRIGWLLVLAAIGIVNFSEYVAVGYSILAAAVAILAVSFGIGIAADRIRKEIQEKVDAELASRQ
jgi:zinc transporter ZupT